MYLRPEDVKVFSSLEVPAHYTIVHVLDKNIAEKIHEIALSLKKLDDSLIINEPENYHITFFWKGLDSNLEEKLEDIEKIINSTNFEFDIEELLFGPLGVSLKFYPKSEDFVNARMEICKLTNTPVLIDERFVTTWVAVAAYSQTPNENIKKYVQENFKINFGTYKPKDFTLYISTNKGLVNPKFIKRFECKK